jgi:hypothetical protein
VRPAAATKLGGMDPVAVGESHMIGGETME